MVFIQNDEDNYNDLHAYIAGDGFADGGEEYTDEELELMDREGDGRGDDWKYAEFETPEFDG